jgi:hypothetical protein
MQLSIRTLRLENRTLALAAQSGGETNPNRKNAAGLVRELAARRARSEDANPSPFDHLSDLKPLNALIYAGQETPLAAVDSSLWAIYHGDIDKLRELIALTPDGIDAAAALFANLPAEAQVKFQTPENMIALLVAYTYNAIGYQVLESNQDAIDPNRWTVKAVVQMEDGRTARPNVNLLSTDGKWQVQFDGNAVRQFATVLNTTEPTSGSGQPSVR